MTSADTVLCRVQNGVAVATLNRPQRRNAYTLQMGGELTRAFRQWRDDRQVRAVVLTGAGESFCAGVDLAHLKAHLAGDSGASSAPPTDGAGKKLGEEDFLRALPLELLHYPKPLIAAVNGHAIGVGVTMILPFDVRIAAENAVLGLAFLKHGILPGLGSSHLLPRLVGRARALDLVLSARNISAAEALEYGLVQRVVSGDALLAEARATAAAMAAHNPRAVAAAKRLLNFGAANEMEAAMQNEVQASAALREWKR